MNETKERRIRQRLHVGVLSEWYCIPVDLTEVEEVSALETIRDAWGGPVSDLSLIRDRPYGGFTCGEDPGRRHVLFAAGNYTYLGENHPAEPGRRTLDWEESIRASAKTGPFIGGGSFTEDAPAGQAVRA